MDLSIYHENPVLDEWKAHFRTMTEITNGLHRLAEAGRGWSPDGYTLKFKTKLAKLEGIASLATYVEFSPDAVWEKFVLGLDKLAKSLAWSWWPTFWRSITGPTNLAEDRKDPRSIDLGAFREHLWADAPVDAPFLPELLDIPEGKRLLVRQRRPRLDGKAVRLNLLVGATADARIIEVPTDGKAFVTLPRWEECEGEPRDAFNRVASRRYFLEPMLLPERQAAPVRSVAQVNEDIFTAAARQEAARKLHIGEADELLALIEG